MLGRFIGVLCFNALFATSAIADPFEDAAIARMIQLKKEFKKQVGTQYHGSASKAGLTFTDCFRYTRSVLMHAFQKVGQYTHANKIKALYQDGGDVAKYLVEKAGWRAFFWAPDVRLAGDGNDAHAYYAHEAGTKKKHSYLSPKVHPTRFVPIGGYVVNYNPTPLEFYNSLVEPDKERKAATKKNAAGLEYINKVPFCYGITRGADHTFLFSKGKVYEAHWDIYGPTSYDPDDTTKPGDEKLYEVSDFGADFSNYKRSANREGWLSGVLICPPSAPAAPAALANYDKGI